MGVLPVDLIQPIAAADTLVGQSVERPQKPAFALADLHKFDPRPKFAGSHQQIGHRHARLPGQSGELFTSPVAKVDRQADRLAGRLRRRTPIGGGASLLAWCWIGGPFAKRNQTKQQDCQ